MDFCASQVSGLGDGEPEENTFTGGMFCQRIIPSNKTTRRSLTELFQRVYTISCIYRVGACMSFQDGSPGYTAHVQEWLQTLAKLTYRSLRVFS
jgi:hypothetical protein